MANEQDEKREKAINAIVNLLRINSFSVAYKVVKKPKGVKVIYEVTQKEMDEVVEALKRRDASRLNQI